MNRFAIFGRPLRGLILATTYRPLLQFVLQIGETNRCLRIHKY
jgi:hypothetical protein